MENDRVAKFFIGTLLEQQIETLQVQPQEFTHKKDIEGFVISIFRLDFMATIKTETGEYKKILIEVQKAQNDIDLMRFRKYLGEQYRKEEQPLPITTIYILGFNLPKIETACIKVERNYKDLINKTILETKSDFVEKLTHDSYIVQVGRITDRYQTRLDKLLSVFEQSNFIDNKKITKQFKHPTDEEDVKILTDILQHAGSNPEERKLLEDEQEAWRTLNAMFGRKDKELKEAIATIEEKDKALADMAAEIEKLKAMMKENNKENKL
jgi:hypothetical protein